MQVQEFFESAARVTVATLLGGFFILVMFMMPFVIGECITSWLESDVLYEKSVLLDE